MVLSTASASSERFSAISVSANRGRSPRSDSTTARASFSNAPRRRCITFLHQLHRLLRFQLFFSAAALYPAGHGSPLPVAATEAVYWLPVRGTDIRSESRARRPNWAAIICSASPSPASPGINCPLYCAARLSRVGVNCKQCWLRFRPKNRTAPEWSSTVQNLLPELDSLMLTIFSTDMESLSVVDIFFDMGA